MKGGMSNTRRYRALAFLLGLSFVVAACSETEAAGPRIDKSGTRELHHRHDGFPHYIGHFEAEVLSSLPHETTAVTNGLEWFEGALHESTGGTNQSSVSRISAESGDVINRFELADGKVGSGLTYYNGKFYQLVRDSTEVLVYDAESLAQEESLTSEDTGWGLCNSSDKFFVVSDGTSQLKIRNPETFQLERQFTVELAGSELAGLDELECIGDQIWATITDPDDQNRASTIIVINIDTEEVEATIDASQVVPEGLADETTSTLSGIALRPEDNSLWLTGRQWPASFEVKLTPVDVR